MRITDAHVHTSTLWYEPLESLIYAMDRNDIAGAVLVQIMGQFDNAYILAAAARQPDRFRAVVLVDHRRPDAPRTLERLADAGAAGVRLPASARSPGPDPLAIWRAAGDLGLPVSCLGDPDEFASDAFAALVADTPDARIVLEHLAGANAPDPTGARERALDLGRFANVLIKLPGAAELVERRDELDGPERFQASPVPLVRRAIDLFGPDRVMWGSDFPLVMAREGYAGALASARDACASLADPDRAQVFGGVVRRVFFESR